jgi:hypothetical protein
MTNKLRKSNSAFEIEIDSHLKIALQEIGHIKPWFDKETDEWIFEHPLYPESCSGDTKQEVIEKYPLYLRQFIEHRLKNQLAPWIEKKTGGRGGKRAGAGRPKGTVKNPTRVVRLPEDIAVWLQENPARIARIRHMMRG